MRTFREWNVSHQATVRDEPVRLSQILAVFAITCTLLVATTAVVLLFSGVGRPVSAHVDPADLLAGSDELPDVPFVRARGTDSRINPFPDFFGAESFAGRRWGVRHDHYLLVQSVLRYPGPERASAEFDAAPYGRVFDDPMRRAAARPVDLSTVDLAADSAVMGCMQHLSLYGPHCYGWAYRGRYGDYVVEITYSGDRDPWHRWGLPEQTFLDIVKAADRHIARFNIN